jgi:hypothetical protein
VIRPLRRSRVLVTADDAMPWEHGDALRGIEATVATVDGVGHLDRSTRGVPTAYRL